MRLPILAFVLLLPACPDADLGDETDERQREVDLEPPKVIRLSLGPLEAVEPPRGISVLPTIEVELSEPLDPATLGPASIMLRRTSESEAAVEVDVTLRDALLTIVPRATLAAESTHRLLLAGTLRDLHGAPLADARGIAGPFEYAFVTGSATSGPPVAALASPVDGSVDVPRNLLEIVVTFSEPVWGTMRCGSEAGRCEGEATCRIGVVHLLAASTEYRLDLAEVADADGSVARGSGSFRTAATVDQDPPEIGESACAAGETAIGPACASLRDVSVTVRFASREAAIGWASAGEVRNEDSTPSLAHRLRLVGLEPETTYAVEIGARDAAGNELALGGLEIRTRPPLAAVVITEVYADAAGPEPAQEFVEILNDGSSAIDLGGFVLGDGGGPGAPLPAGSSLPPGRWALIVSDRFDPESRLDPALAPDTVLLRVAGSLGTNGLLNAGEPVWLVDGAGNELSRHPSFLAPRAGVSIERTARDADEQDPASWIHCPQGGATPGTAGW